jgi:putative ABC transport system permease protein
MSAPRFTGFLLGAFAAMALTLSAIGIYGVLSYLVSRRTREIGIRVAIGAGRSHVLSMVLRSGLRLAVVGVIIGLVAAAVSTRLMATLLHDVSPLDPTTFVIVGLGLSMIAALASLVPAWRATRVDPVVALKAE